MDQLNSKPASPLFLAAAIGFSAGFLLCGYEFVRSPCTSLFVDRVHGYGAANLPVVTALMPLGVVALLYLYGSLLSWCGPRRTLLWTSLGSSVALLLCFALIEHGFKPARGALYILREAYVVILIEQYWSFLDSSLGTAQAKNLNGPICGVASLGAILGGLLVNRYAQDLGTSRMLLFGVLATLPAALCSDLAYARCGEPRHAPEARPAGRLGLGLFSRYKMLWRLLLIILSTQIIAGALDFGLQTELAAGIPNQEARTAWSGGFYAWVNVAAAIGQFIVAPLLLRAVSLPLIHYLVPLANLLACVALALRPSLASAAAAYLVFKACDYSVFRAAKEILYIPFPFDVRYRAKELIDVFGYRFGKGGYATILTALKWRGVAFGGLGYGVTALASAGAWVLLLPGLLRHYRERISDC